MTTYEISINISVEVFIFFGRGITCLLFDPVESYFLKEYDANLEQAFPEPDFKHFNFSTSLRNNLTPFNSVWNSNLRKPQSSGLKKHVSNVIYLREIQGKEEKSAQIECQMNLQICNLEKWY